MNKCPCCGSTNIGVMEPKKGFSYGLVSFDKTKETAKLEDVLHVNVYGCLDCKLLMLESPTLTRIN